MINTFKYSKQAREIVRRVFFTASTALRRGQAVCYDRDYGTAAAEDGRRDKFVEVPSTSNNLHFAGVAIKDYLAVSGGQWIEIFEPGSVVPINTLIATTVNATYLSALAGGGVTNAGAWIAGRFPGKGRARALQTITAIAATTDLSVGVFSSSLDGSATYTAATRTVTKTAAFAYVPATANLTGEEYVHIVAGAQDNVGSGASIAPTAGRYKITAKTSDDAVVIESDAASASCDIAFYAVRGSPTVLALLEDGEQSGMVEWLSLITDGSGTTANAAMVSGFTNIFGGFDLDVGDAVDTLANGTFIGQTKGYELMGAITTNDYLVTVTAGEQLDGTTDLATMEFDGANDYSVLQWYGKHWKLMSNSGTGLA